MTRTMICGARLGKDIRMLAEAGTDAVGLITEVWQDIPCKLTRAEAGKLAALVPPFVSSNLIITEEKPDEICLLVDYVKPDVLQVHGFNTPDDIGTIRQKTGIKIIKTLHFKGRTMIEEGDPADLARRFLEAGADAILVDSAGERKVGSTGETMSFDIACEIRDAIYPAPLILAGGLNTNNIAEAIRTVRPYAVDVFSAVNTNGYLDEQKVAAFIVAVNHVPEVNHAG